MLFSATLEGEIAKLADGSTRDAVRHELGGGRPTVSEATHRFVGVAHTDRFRMLVRELAGDRGLTLVFTRTKRGADRLARNLKKDGFRAGALHGDLTQSQRERALGHFAAGRNDVLVATDVAARGLDLEHISHVINYDPPADDTTYVHRVGRTARAGRSGTGITFVTPEQRRDVAGMAKALKLDREYAAAGLAVVSATPPSRTRNRKPQPKLPANRSGSKRTSVPRRSPNR
jgi:superfamily II DNA/RNA helicase